MQMQQTGIAQSTIDEKKERQAQIAQSGEKRVKLKLGKTSEIILEQQARLAQPTIE